MFQKSLGTLAVVGIHIGKNSFHIVGLDQKGAIVPRQKRLRVQVVARLANMPVSHVGIEERHTYNLRQRLNGTGTASQNCADAPIGSFGEGVAAMRCLCSTDGGSAVPEVSCV